MAKISGLPAALGLGGDEKLPLVQGLATRSVSLSALVAFMMPLLPGWLKGDKGEPGAAQGVVASLAELKAAALSDVTRIWNGAPFTWETVAAPYTSDEDRPYITKVASDIAPLSIGAWVRQKADSVTYRQAGTSTRTRTIEDKGRERRTILDYVGGDADGITSNTAAFEAMLADGGGYLPRQDAPYVLDAQIVMPAGSFLLFQDGTQVEWMGGVAPGSFDFIFVGDDNCSIGAESGEVEFYSSVADRYRWLLLLNSKKSVTLRGVFCRNMQRIYCASSGGGYAGVVTSGAGANICENIRLFGGGTGYDVALTGAQSTGADHLSYTFDWEINDARHNNGVSGIQWWGGDGNPSTGNGVPGNERKCRNGVIRRSSATNCIGAGIWGAMGENVLVQDCYVENCGDVGFDTEGGIKITWDRCKGRYCVQGFFTEFFFNVQTKYLSCTAIAVNGQNVVAFYGAGGISDGSRFIDCDFFSEGNGVAAFDSAQGSLRNLTLSGSRLTDVVISTTYNQNQNVKFSDLDMHFTRAIGITAIRAGQSFKVDDRAGTLILDGVRITTDVAQSGVAIQIDQNDPAAVPQTVITNCKVSAGFALFDFVASGTTGHFDLTNNRFDGAGGILKNNGGAVYYLNANRNATGGTLS